MAFNLVLALIWLMIGLPLVAVNVIGQPMFGLEPGQPGLTMGIVAFLLAVYNLARFYAARVSRRRGDLAKKVTRRVVHQDEYHPEFDFTRRDDAPPPP